MEEGFYKMATNINNVTEEMFQANIEAIVNRVNQGLTNYDKEISFRYHEIETILMFHGKSGTTNRNNKKRIEYYKKEIIELIKRRDADK